jgi:5-formyltetrahydrofolate cyclo-ligase
LPVIIAKGSPLEFRYWKKLDDLMPSPFFPNILEPSKDAPVCHPSVVIVPLLGFDRDLNRLGYGGGFYDRTLREDQVKIGVGYEFMKVDQIPFEPTDVPLNYVVTE